MVSCLLQLPPHQYCRSPSPAGHLQSAAPSSLQSTQLDPERGRSDRTASQPGGEEGVMHNQWDGWEPLSSVPRVLPLLCFSFCPTSPCWLPPCPPTSEDPGGSDNPHELQHEGKWATLKGTFAFHQTLCHQTHTSPSARLRYFYV